VASSSLVLDPSGANIQLNQVGSATGYLLEGGQRNIDWGGGAIQDIINAGSFRLEDIDGILAAQQTNRVLSIPLSIRGSSTDDLRAKLSALNFAINRASRWQTSDLVLTPAGSTHTSTFKVVGGRVDSPYNDWAEMGHVMHGTLALQALPFVYGAKQTGGTLGTSAAPLVNAAGPSSFTLTPTGDAGDVLADVTIIFSLNADTAGAVSIAALTGNTAWTVTSDITSWANGSGGGTHAAVTNAKYKGGAAPGYTVAAVNTIEQALTKTFTTTDFPINTPIRILLTADDTQVVAARRGLFQFRLVVSAGGVPQYGEWCSVPAAAGNGTTTHFLQAMDMGTFVFPPGPTGSGGFSGSTTVAIEVQDGNTLANVLPCVFDSLIFLPDASSMIAEWPVTRPAATTQIRLENDMLYNQSDGSPQTVLLTGAHVRCRGATRYGVWASALPLANAAGDVTFSTMKAWAEYTPRYIDLAPA
jgi:hypothetical protein